MSLTCRQQQLRVSSIRASGLRSDFAPHSLWEFSNGDDRVGHWRLKLNYFISTYIATLFPTTSFSRVNDGGGLLSYLFWVKRRGRDRSDLGFFFGTLRAGTFSCRHDDLCLLSLSGLYSCDGGILI